MAEVKLRLFLAILILYLKETSSTKITITQQPQEATVNPGENVELKCVFSEKPAYCAWSRDTHVFVPDGHHIEFTGLPVNGDCSIRINSVTLEDNGLYQCIAPAAGSDPGVKSRYAQLTVLYAPKFPIIEYKGNVIPNGESIHVEESTTSIEVQCTIADGSPAAELEWISDDSSLGSGNTEIRRSADNPHLWTISSVLNLTIENTNSSRTNLSCRSLHPTSVEMLYNETYAVIVTPVPVTAVTASFEGNSARNLTFTPGSSVTMICIADGFPAPDYLWLKENITGVWFPFETSPNITIVAQEGHYVCAAQNNENDDYVTSNTLTITIGDLTVVEHPQNTTVKLGENVILNCTFNGRVDTCTWNKDGNYFLAGNNGTVFIGDESKGDCTIFIQNIQLQQDGIYFCEVQGAKSDEAKVIVLQAPKSPVVIFANEEIPDNSIIYLPNGKWPVSCKAEDGKPVAEISWFQNLCVEEGSEQIETNPENPKLTTVTSTINITLDENSSDVRLTCISKHPAYDTQGFEVISVNFRSLGPVKVVTATVVNHFRNFVKLSDKENMELICSASGSTIADYQWEMKDENEEQWKFLKSGPTIYMNPVAGTYRCKAENRLNNGNAVISNEITISR